MAYCKYTTAVVGGTFDLLHKGHEALLRHAFSLAEIVYVTITSDTYTVLHKKKAAPFSLRKKRVVDFLQKEGFLQRARIESIDDVYGIALKEGIALEAIIVTDESLGGAKQVNEKRKKQGLAELAIEVVPLVTSEIGIPISSTYIHTGIFDSQGTLQIKNTPLFLPEQVRQALHRPFDTVLQNGTESTFKDPQKIIAVGDVTTRMLHKAGYSPVLSLIDFTVGRKRQPEILESLGLTGQEHIFHVENPAGEITPSLWGILNKALQKVKKGEKTLVIVAGEEDLTVLPLLLLLPIGYTICYGQPHEGMVIIPVDEGTKKHALDLLSQFETVTTRGH